MEYGNRKMNQECNRVLLRSKSMYPEMRLDKDEGKTGFCVEAGIAGLVDVEREVQILACGYLRIVDMHISCG